MPCNLSLYPKDWPEIRKTVLLRAGGRQGDPRVGARCERCGVLNYAIGHRESGRFIPTRGNIYYDDFQYATSYAEAREAADHINEWCDQQPKAIIIVLTIAHIGDPDPQNVSLDNLEALCQRCHNCLDAKMRSKNAKRTKAGKIIGPGQIKLFESEQ